jgi:protein-tyrosine phosphatase
MKDIYWIKHDDHSHLAIVARPRGDDWLEEDLAKLKQGGIDVLVSLLTQEENVDLGLTVEDDLAERVGMEFVSYPIPDRTKPADSEGYRRLVTELADTVRNGKKVGAHCRGCIGRATVTTAAVLIQLGIKPVDALAMIEEARGCPVPDTLEQLNWILTFRPGR